MILYIKLDYPLFAEEFQFFYLFDSYVIFIRILFLFKLTYISEMQLIF